MRIGKILKDGTIEQEYLNQGYIYKDYEAFENKTDDICYQPEQDEFGDAETYTYSDFLEIANGDEDLARNIFDLVDWQSPETILDEMETY